MVVVEAELKYSNREENMGHGTIDVKNTPEWYKFEHKFDKNNPYNTGTDDQYKCTKRDINDILNYRDSVLQNPEVTLRFFTDEEIQKILKKVREINEKFKQAREKIEGIRVEKLKEEQNTREVRERYEKLVSEKVIGMKEENSLDMKVDNPQDWYDNAGSEDDPALKLKLKELKEQNTREVRERLKKFVSEKEEQKKIHLERLRRSIDRKLNLKEKLKGVIDKEHLSVREYLNKKTQGLKQFTNKKENKVKQTEIEYSTYEDKVMVTGIKNVLSVKELQEQLGTGGFEVYMDTLPFYYASDTNPQYVRIQRMVIEGGIGVIRERVMQVGDVLSRDVFGQLISAMKEAGSRLGRIMKSKDTKRVVKI